MVMQALMFAAILAFARALDGGFRFFGPWPVSWSAFSCFFGTTRFWRWGRSPPQQRWRGLRAGERAGASL